VVQFLKILGFDLMGCDSVKPCAWNPNIWTQISQLRTTLKTETILAFEALVTAYGLQGVTTPKFTIHIIYLS
jgi:hypothetical protein